MSATSLVHARNLKILLYKNSFINSRSYFPLDALCERILVQIAVYVDSCFGDLSQSAQSTPSREETDFHEPSFSHVLRVLRAKYLESLSLGVALRASALFGKQYALVARQRADVLKIYRAENAERK